MPEMASCSQIQLQSDQNLCWLYEEASNLQVSIMHETVSLIRLGRCTR